MDKIHIIYAFNDDFAKFAAVSIISLLENNLNDEISLHLFHINCQRNTIDKIRQILERYTCKVTFHNFSPETLVGFPETGQYSLACYLRLWTPSILPTIDKAIYIDSDTLIRKPLRELWDTDISNHSLGACLDSTFSRNIVAKYLTEDIIAHYFNSGVLLLNLAYWRENNVEAKLCKYLKHNNVKLPDQDALNAVLYDTVKIMHPKWNALASYFTFTPKVPLSQFKYIPYLCRNACIVHFIGEIKPWHRESWMAYKSEWLNYYAMSPWSNESLPKLHQNKFISICVTIKNRLKYLITCIKLRK